jgi:hypothetical protein
MKSMVLTAALVAAYTADQAHLSGGHAHNVDRHQEECDDGGVVVNCQVEEGWTWSPCDFNYSQSHATRSHALRQQKICMAIAWNVYFARCMTICEVRGAFLFFVAAIGLL